MSLVSVRTLLGAATLLAASFSSHATLIVNGDFEENFVASNKWKVFASTAVAGWQGSDIEIWNAYNSVTAPSGNNFIELNSNDSSKINGKWTIFQTFATEVGREYNLSFFYRARSKDTEAFSVSVADVSWNMTDHVVAGWSYFFNSFTATGSTSTLNLTSISGTTLGNFIDNITVTAAPGRDIAVDVPAPATLAAFGVGLLALVGGRRLRRTKSDAK
ncbi:MAG: PEP-CTERM sorting domain-containing protein [Rheinheimera sp.]|uniref:DUF642 domain-containing protein n=1 Tax=Arsukibacterium sp. UBA3155 TaxID=1946058 RepID=UPI000C8FAAD1|nr:DUF642 domain-containing protein [Arsukibacterium sp. UBA3155]MAD76599.1 PEP-CTERM sorting domain-containing protein [Rheinheimera sp.]|tara:strand:+ start:15750 stop:16400 length:651 start_codon:yes stop_codon:yes gene_type:complete